MDFSLIFASLLLKKFKFETKCEEEETFLS